MTQATERQAARERIAGEDIDWPTTHTSMGESELVETPYSPTGGHFPQTWRFADALIVTERPREEDIRSPDLPRWGKWYWYLPSSRLGAPEEIMVSRRAGRYVILIEATEEQLGHPEDVVTSMTLWPPLWQHAEPERRVWRGVFCPPYRREVLFSQQVEIRTAELPRWKPHITIDSRRLERLDE